DFTLQVGGTISGTVYESDGITPLTGAWINVEEATGGWSLGGATTGLDGTYTVQGLPPAEVRVRADVDNYAFEYYDDAGQNGDNATQLTVAPGAEISNIDF